MSSLNTTMMIESVRQPGLKNILGEASRALAHLDAETLEEMAAYCAALIQDDETSGSVESRLDSECKEAWKEFAIFVRVLESTKANLNVMRRLRQMRASRLEYGPSLGRGDLSAGGYHGDH